MTIPITGSLKETLNRQADLFDKFTFDEDGNYLAPTFESTSAFNKAMNFTNVRTTVAMFNYIADELPKEDPLQFEVIRRGLIAMADYVNARNNFTAKMIDIIKSDLSPQDKKQAQEAVDFTRTKYHNESITVINTINGLAEKLRKPKPFLTPYGETEFDRSNPDHREMVATIIEHLYPTITVTNKIFREKEAGPDLSKLTPTQLLKMTLEKSVDDK